MSDDDMFSTESSSRSRLLSGDKELLRNQRGEYKLMMNPINDQGVIENHKKMLSHMNQIIILQALLNFLVIIETFFSIQSTEYFYPWNAKITINGDECDFGDIEDQDCVKMMCDFNNEDTNFTLIANTCSKKDFITSHGLPLANIILSGMSFISMIYISISTHKAYSEGKLAGKRSSLTKQIVFLILLLLSFIITKSIEIHRIEIHGLKVSEGVEFGCLLTALLGELLMAIVELKHILHKIGSNENIIEMKHKVDDKLIKTLRKWFDERRSSGLRSLPHDVNHYNLYTQLSLFYEMHDGDSFPSVIDECVILTKNRLRLNLSD